MSDGPSDAYRNHYPPGCIVDHTKTPVTNIIPSQVTVGGSMLGVNSNYLAGVQFCDVCGQSKPALTYRASGLVCCPNQKVCKECLETEEYYDKDADCGECEIRKDPEFTNEMAGIIFPPVSKLTEGTKFDGGKPTTSLLPSKPLLEIAKVLDFGAAKYEPHNWKKGIKYSRVLSAAQRHLLAWNDGEQLDPDSKLTHLAHAACNILFLLEYELSGMTEFDDRRKK